jgi:hypothetical protein
MAAKKKAPVEQPEVVELPEVIELRDNQKAKMEEILDQVTQAQAAFDVVIKRYQSFVYGLSVGMDVDLETYIMDEEKRAFTLRPEPEEATEDEGTPEPQTEAEVTDGDEGTL